MEGKKITKKFVKLNKYEADLEKNIEKKPLAKAEKEKHINQLLKASENYIKKDKYISI